MQKKFFNSKVKDYWRSIDKNILICFVLLFILGLFFSFASTSSLAGERLNKDYFFFFYKHLVFVTASLFIMFLISFIDLKLIKKTLLPIFIFFLVLLILVPIIGIEVKGAKRWLNLYFFRLQPIEIVKPFFILVSSLIISSKEIKNKNSSYLISFLILLSIILLLVNQPDIGQSVLLVLTWLAIVFISGINIFYIITLFTISIISISALVILLPGKFSYITNRLITFVDPSKGDNYQSEKALEAIKVGGMKGQGMGEGVLKESVPEAHTDYIIAVIAEEFGSIISILIVCIFLYIAFKIIKNSILKEQEYLKISLCGFASILIFQTFIHIGVNTSLLPTTGMTLPFLSYGGSSLIGSAILAGMILNFTKQRLNENEL
jgi:cell division protein FtsW